MERSAPGDGVVEVEIVEVRDPADRRRPDRAGGRTRHRHAAVWSGVAVFGLLVCTVVVTNVTEARHQASRLNALADVPGILAPLDGAPRELWRSPGRELLADSPAALVLRDADGGLRGLDPVTGATLWLRSPGPRETCLPVGGAGAGGVASGPVVVVCGPVRDADDPAAADPAHLVAVDVTSGGEAATLDLATAPVTLDVVDDDVVVSRVGERATVQVLRWDPGADRVVWSYRSEPGRADAVLEEGWWLAIPERSTLWFGRTTMLALDAGSGREVSADDPPAIGHVGQALPLPDGGSLTWGDAVAGAPTGMQVTDPDGTLRFAFDGEPWLADVSDGSQPDVIVVQRAVSLDVLGLDVRTGERVWNAPAMQGLHPYLQVGGVVVAAGPLRVVALDLATGARLWETGAPVGRPRTWPVTDGRVVILLGWRHGTLGLSARDLRTGASQWWVETPEDVMYVEAAGRHTLLLHTRDEVVAYG